MNEEDAKDKKIKELEAEIVKLRDACNILRDKLSSQTSYVNRMIERDYNDIMPDREDR
jgi:hypothetical protein